MLLVTADVFSILLIRVTLMMDVMFSFETLVLTKATWRNVQEDDTLKGKFVANLRLENS
jgi:hypothetical protein